MLISGLISFYSQNNLIKAAVSYIHSIITYITYLTTQISAWRRILLIYSPKLDKTVIVAVIILDRHGSDGDSYDGGRMSRGTQ